MFGSSPASFVGSGKKLKEIVLENGTTLTADLCVLGIGRSEVKNAFRSRHIEWLKLCCWEQTMTDHAALMKLSLAHTSRSHCTIDVFCACD